MPDHRTTVVVATRNRPSELRRTLDRLAATPERPPVTVVDNGSTCADPADLRRQYPDVSVVALPANEGAAARTLGARLASTPFVAFCDDDSWWEPGSLAAAADVLQADPRVALVAARVLVGPEERVDPVSLVMATGPLGPDLVSPRRPSEPPGVVGFLACAAAVRRDAFLAVGGFPRVMGIGGEEAVVAAGLLGAGWQAVYDDGVVVHHHPSSRRDSAVRRRRNARNDLWTAWNRLPAVDAARRSAHVLRRSWRDPAGLTGAADAVAGWRWVRDERQPVPTGVAAAMRRL